MCQALGRAWKKGAAITLTAIFLTIAVFSGALVQRITGLGFSLLAAPFLVLLAGPFHGVLLANFLALLVSGTTLATTWRSVDIKRALLLVPAGLLGVIPGVLVGRRLAPGSLQITIGLLIFVSIIATLAIPKFRLPPSIIVTVSSGIASGFMTATAGVGGPVLTVYAVATGWAQRNFASTAQISFAAQAAMAVTLKGMPDLSGAGLALLLATVAAGLVCGHFLTPKIPSSLARQVVITLALLGAVGAIVKGVLDSVTAST